MYTATFSPSKLIYLPKLDSIWESLSVDNEIQYKDIELRFSGFQYP